MPCVYRNRLSDAFTDGEEDSEKVLVKEIPCLFTELAVYMTAYTFFDIKIILYFQVSMMFLIVASKLCL